MLLGSYRTDILGVLASVALATACTAATDDVGTIGVALTAADAGGATYRLTPGARLAMSGGTFYDEYSLDGDAAFVRIDVPPGDYAADLVNDAGDGPQWPLVRRELDGSVETVLATLVTPMPAPLTITADGLTNLVLRFEVPDVGPVTFAEGSVDVSIEVVGTTPANLDVHYDGTLDVSSVVIDPTAPAALAPRMPAAGDAGLPFALYASITGPWAKTSATMACAPVSFVNWGGAGGVVAVMMEATAPGASFCIFDDGVSPAQGQIVLSRTGAPTTPTFSDLGSGSYSFLAFTSVEIPAGAFDGETLDLGVLLGAHTFPATMVTRVSHRAADGEPRIHWHRANYTGQLTLSLIPTP